MRKIIHKITDVMVIIGFLFVLGTAGAMDCTKIEYWNQFWTQLAVSGMFFIFSVFVWLVTKNYKED